MTEKILCAAIKIDDNIIPGFRHGNCFHLAQLIYYEIKIRVDMQGFLTSTGRFVDRKEAFGIALKADQIRFANTKNNVTRILVSEDLY